jgi:phosphoribosyl 1,2-cyclic phosphodiesterase
VFCVGKKRLGVLTDTGCSTPHIETMLNGCDALVLECNHDVTMLANSNYPLSLKKRIGGRFGHLNNTDAAALLARLDCSRLQHVVAAHLSQKNNTQKLAADALGGALNCDPSWIAMATQNNGLTWREIS